MREHQHSKDKKKKESEDHEAWKRQDDEPESQDKKRQDDEPDSEEHEGSEKKKMKKKVFLLGVFNIPRPSPFYFCWGYLTRGKAWYISSRE